MFYCRNCPKFALMKKYSTLVIIVDPKRSIDSIDALIGRREILSMSQNVDHVIILPMDGADQRADGLPDNVSVCRPAKDLCGSFTLGRRLMTLFRPSMWRLAGGDLKRESVAFYVESFLIYSALKKWIVSEGIETNKTLVYCSWGSAWSLAVEMICNECGMDMICRADNPELYVDGHRKANQRVAERCEGIYTSSEDAKNWLQARYPEMESKFRVAVAGSSKQDRRALASSHKANERCLTFLSVARGSTFNDLDLKYRLMRALAIARPGTRVRWIHVGDLDVSEVIDRSASDRKPDNLEIDLRISPLLDDIDSLFMTEAIDWTLIPGREEVCPRLAYISMSYGVPVVATMVRGLEEVVTDDCGLLLADNTSPEEFVLGLLPCVESDLRMDAMRRSAFERWQRHYDADRKI